MKNIVFLFCIGMVTMGQSQGSILDQEQYVLGNEFTYAIGGNSEQKLAQVVTTGLTGLLAAVRLPIFGSAGSNLLIELSPLSNGLSKLE